MPKKGSKKKRSSSGSKRKKSRPRLSSACLCGKHPCICLKTFHSPKVLERWLFENAIDVGRWKESSTTKSVEDLFNEIKERRCALYKEGIGSSCRVYRGVRVLKFLIQRNPLNEEIEDEDVRILGFVLFFSTLTHTTPIHIHTLSTHS
jgi:hypothetical protein